MTEPLISALRGQAGACAALGSPFMGRLLGLLANRLRPGTPVADRLFAWPGDISPSAQSVPLRLAGALHRLVLSGEDAALVAAYPPNQVQDDQLWRAVSNALEAHCDDVLRWLDSPPQTNAVGRAAALIAVGRWLGQAHDLPLMLSELGASAGLNLNWDRFALDIGGERFGPPDAGVVLSPKWHGDLPASVVPRVVARRGVDLEPMDMADGGDRLRLLSYLWPDQPERTRITRAAMDLPAAPVDRGDAIDWLDQRLPAQAEGRLHLIYHTIAWQYFGAERQARGRALMDAAGARATRQRPLAVFAMEADGDGPGAALTLRLWPGGQVRTMGRADFHGRWIDWHPPSVGTIG